MLLHLYTISPKKSAPTQRERNGRASSRSDGHTAALRERSREAAARVRDAEEFELEGLMSEDELLGSPESPPAKQTQLVN
jgi:hypothetical protein